MEVSEALAILKQRLVNDPMSLAALQVIEDDINAVEEAIQGSGLGSYSS
jgi:hypothetical protein